MTNSKFQTKSKIQNPKDLEPSLKPKFDKANFYSPLAAVKLAQETARNKFEGKIEVHANLKSKGKFGKWKTERKTPLLHAVLGKQSAKPEALTKELEQLIKTVGPSQIKKLVVCATMGPGVKVKIEVAK